MLLLLAGTSEARAIAKRLHVDAIPAIASLSGATRDPADLSITIRRGGFGGDDGFQQYLKDQYISAVLDATHPFATAVSTRTARICHLLKLPHLQVMRPPWVPTKGDNWVNLVREEDAASHIPPDKTVFLATGRQTLDKFANLTGRRMICRQIDPPNREFPFPNGEFLVGRPPFSESDEIVLFQQLGVDWLVVKNAGGQASRTKLDAARILGLPVAIIARPPALACDRVKTVEQAMTWVHSLSW